MKRINWIYDKRHSRKWRSRFADLKLSKKMILAFCIAMGISCVISMIALQVSFGIYDRQALCQVTAGTGFFYTEGERQSG